MKQLTELIFTLYYLFNIAVGFGIYGFWWGVLYICIPVAPMVYLVQKFM